MARPTSEAEETTGQVAQCFDENRKDMEKVVIIGHAVACPTRLAILRSLGEAGCSLTVTAAKVGLAVSTTSHHLNVLGAAGLVTKTPRGRQTIYKWSRARWALVRQRPPAPTVPADEAP
jgi:DNA-binding transcriptional ArsR family regulator